MYICKYMLGSIVLNMYAVGALHMFCNLLFTVPYMTAVCMKLAGTPTYCICM